MKVILSTQNKHKLKEIRRILKGIKVKGLGIKVKEDGKTFEQNALKKAKAAAKISKSIALADDSGLMVEALNGKPGVKSARFVKGIPTPDKLCLKLLTMMEHKYNRKAKFVCVVAVAYPSGKYKVIRGEVRGKITEKMSGIHGFGYDPVFMPSGYKKTFAQMSPAQKNCISHRAKAFIRVKSYLSKVKI